MINASFLIYQNVAIFSINNYKLKLIQPICS